MDIATDIVKQINSDSTSPRQRAEAVADTFASIFVQQMVQQMRDSATLGGGEGMFGKGPGAGTYESWFDQHLARHLTTQGGIGLAGAMVRDWEQSGWIEPTAEGAAHEQATATANEAARRISLEA